MNKKIPIEVAYAKTDIQILLALEVELGTTLEEAIRQSKIMEVFPEINLTHNKVGIFGELRELNDVLKEGDRIEIYRPLNKDPKEARRLRARKMKVRL